MNAPGYASLTPRQRLGLAALAASPFVALALVQTLGLTGVAVLGLGGVAGAALLAAVLTNPRWGVYYLVFHVYSGLSFYVPGVVPMAVLGVTVVAALLEVLRGEPDRVTDGPFLAFTGVFVVLLLQSMLVAHYPELSMGAIVVFFKTLAVVLMIVNFTRTRDELRRLVLLAFAGAVATVVFGVLNLKLGLYSTDNVIGGVQVYRFSGAHANPNNAAAVMCCAIPFGLFTARCTRGPWRRTASLLGVVVLVVGTFSTFSRSAIFPFAVIVAATIAREVRSRAGYLSTAVVLTLAILLTPRYYWEDRLLNMWSDYASGVGKDFSVLLRAAAMKTSWAQFLDHPLTGIGIQNFVERGATDVIRRIVAHNSYLEVMVGTGVFGFAAFAGMVAAGLRHAVRGARRAWSSDGEAMRSLSFYLVLSAVSIAISALFGSIQFFYPFWIPVAAGLVIGNLTRAEAKAV